MKYKDTLEFTQYFPCFPVAPIEEHSSWFYCPSGNRKFPIGVIGGSKSEATQKVFKCGLTTARWEFIYHNLINVPAKDVRESHECGTPII